MEILLVVGIIAILAGIVIVAINPSKQLATVRNTERKSDIKQLDSAILQYYIDNFYYPTSITSDLKEVCNTGSVSSTTVAVDSTACGSLVNLSKLVPDYITAIPKDPKATSTGNGTGYYVKQDSTTHKIGTKALLAELDQDININAASSTVAEVEEEEETCDATCLGMRDYLVAHLKMNDTSGTTVEDTQSYDGTSANSVTSVAGATADTGTALSFNGSSDYVDMGLNASDYFSGEISGSLWLKAESYDGSEAKFMNSWDGGAGLMFFYSGSSVLLRIPGDWLTYSMNKASFCNNTWTHWAFTIKDGEQKIYKNGVVVATGSAAGNLATNSLVLRLGRGYDSDAWYKGGIDDVRIYSKVLSQTEITSLAAGTEAE